MPGTDIQHSEVQQIEAAYIAIRARGVARLAYGTSRHTFMSQKREHGECLVAFINKKQASVELAMFRRQYA